MILQANSENYLPINQGLLILPVVTAVIIIIINCLGWWLWTSVCRMLSFPQAVRIQTYSGPLTPWLILSPAFTPSLFVIFLSLSHNTFTATLSAAFLSLKPSSEFVANTRTCTQKHMSATQKPDLASREFFHFLLPGESTKVQSRPLHAMWGQFT